MSNYNYLINWQKIVKENLPLFLHKPIRLNRIYAMIKPFKIIYSQFLITREEYVYKVAYTHQKIYLEKILNDWFDPILRRIYLEDSVTVNQFYLYKNIEAKPPFYLYKNADLHAPVYLYKSEEFSSSSNFIVFVPTGLVYDEPRMRATINYYRFAGINYSIQTF